MTLQIRNDSKLRNRNCNSQERRVSCGKQGQMVSRFRVGDFTSEQMNDGFRRADHMGLKDGKGGCQD